MIVFDIDCQEIPKYVWRLFRALVKLNAQILLHDNARPHIASLNRPLCYIKSVFWLQKVLKVLMNYIDVQENWTSLNIFYACILI